MGKRAILSKKAKIAAVEHKLDGETPNERYLRRLQDELKPLRDMLEQQIIDKEHEIEAELEAAQNVCKHVDNGGMFYSTCTLCGLVGD